MQCIIFDCDGTLVDSEYLCHFAMQEKLAELAVVESADQMMKDFRGGKLADIIRTLEHRHHLVLDNSFVSSYRQLVTQLFESDLQPIAGVKQLLGQVEILKCVASNGPLAKTHTALRTTGLDGYFNENCFSAYEINAWKPQPDLFLHAALKMDVKPTKCCVVDDSPVGIQAAIAANMQAVYFNPLGVEIKGAITIRKMPDLLLIL
jgi:HAD superfamily hydrolase (TIGR01509 family)